MKSSFRTRCRPSTTSSRISAASPRDRVSFERRWAGLQAHNRWLVDFCSRAPDRERGLIQLLPNDVDAAVAEMRWADGHPAIGGVMLPAVPPNHVVEPYYHERYDPLWRAAVELRAAGPSASGLRQPRRQPRTGCRQGGDIRRPRALDRLTLSHLIVGGVFDRHPDLTVDLDGDARTALGRRGSRTARRVNCSVVQARYAACPARQLNFSGSVRYRDDGCAPAHAARVLPAQLLRRREHPLAARDHVSADHHVERFARPVEGGEAASDRLAPRTRT